MTQNEIAILNEDYDETTSRHLAVEKKRVCFKTGSWGVLCQIIKTYHNISLLPFSTYTKWSDGKWKWISTFNYKTIKTILFNHAFENSLFLWLLVLLLLLFSALLRELAGVPTKAIRQLSLLTLQDTENHKSGSW